MCRGAGMSLPGSAYNSGITMTAQAQTEQQFVIHPATTLGYVHLTTAHLAIYIADAEGNGIELAWDFPREQWPAPEDLMRLGNGPLDPEDLLSELERDQSPWPGAHPDTRIGHVHLHVADLSAAGRFYQGVLGFQATFSYSAARDFGALFVSAGGYHHHIGLNIWRGVGAPPPPGDAVGLR